MTENVATRLQPGTGQQKGWLDWLDLRWVPALVVGFGLLLRLAALMMAAPLPLAGDAHDYHQMALQLLHGDRFTPEWPPGLPYYLVPFLRLFGESQVVSRAAMLLIYVGFSAALYLYAREIGTRRAAGLAVLLFAVFPGSVHFSIEPLTQLPTATCIVAVAFLVTRLAKQTSWASAAVLGLVLSWATLLRPSCGLLLIAAPLYLLLRTRRGASVLLCGTIAFCAVGIWLLKAREMTGDWVMINTANSRNLFYGNNPYTPLYRTWWFGSHKEGEEGVPAEYVALHHEIGRQPSQVRDRLYQQVALQHILSRPDLFVVRTLNRVRCYFAFDTFTGTFIAKAYQVNRRLAFMVLGIDGLLYMLVVAAALVLFFGPWSRLPGAGALTPLLGTALVYSMPYWVSFSHPTYHFPIVPLFSIPAVMAGERLLDGSFRSMKAQTVPVLRRSYALLISLLLFAFIQIEWVLVMRARL